MNESLIAQLDRAVVAHAMWKVRLLDAADRRGGSIDRRTASDCHACAFGKWLDTNRPELGLHPEYQDVHALHEGFHREVGAVLERIDFGRRDAARQALTVGGDLRTCSSRLVLRILRWRDRVSAADSGPEGRSQPA